MLRRKVRGLFVGEFKNVGVQSRNVAHVCHMLCLCERKDGVLI